MIGISNVSCTYNTSYHHTEPVGFHGDLSLSLTLIFWQMIQMVVYSDRKKSIEI